MKIADRLTLTLALNDKTTAQIVRSDVLSHVEKLKLLRKPKAAAVHTELPTIKFLQELVTSHPDEFDAESIKLFCMGALDTANLIERAILIEFIYASAIYRNDSVINALNHAIHKHI